MKTLPHTNADDLDKLLYFLNTLEEKERISPTSLQKTLFPNKTIEQVTFIVQEIEEFDKGLIVLKRWEYGDETKFIFPGPRLQEFMLEEGFARLFKIRVDERIKKEQDENLDRESKQAVIDAVLIAKKANRIAGYANIISLISTLLLLHL